MVNDFFDAAAADAEPVTDAAQPEARSGETRMHRHREDLTSQVSGTAHELDELRARQERLERERQLLEEMARKQERYEEQKRDILEKLGRSLVLMDKDETQAARFCEILAVIRDRFRDTLAEIQGINEAGWTDATFGDDLNRAAVLVEDARKTYRKGMAKIEGENWSSLGKGGSMPEVLARSEMIGDVPRSFGFWLKAGFAFSLPFLLLAALSVGAALALRAAGWW